MGAFLDKPKTEKYNEHGSGNGLLYGLSSMQGWRVEMEDAHSAIIGLPHSLKDWSFFAVFDGHAGAKVSAYCAKQLLEAITSNDDFLKNGVGGGKEPTLDDVKRGIKTGFLNMDTKLREIPEIVSGEDKSGSTAVCALITPGHIFLANCGDSRAIVCRDKGKVHCATQDHKPINPIEKERIQNAGGSVMIQRVNGSLAVSRALGDFEYKNVRDKGPCEQLVSPEPEISEIVRSDTDEFLVLACDGIWDVMSNEELAEFVSNRMTLTDDLMEICNSIVDTCLFKGSRDNMSIVIITFNGAPKVCEVAQKREAELDSLLEAKINEILVETDPKDVRPSQIVHQLAIQEIPGLPPGGGLMAKRSTIDAIIKRIVPSAFEEPDVVD